MTVNTGVKGTLAKLLATEDLIIEHKQCETASFDVKRRVLTLPQWEKATEQVYDLLVAHEVGHALYTPADWNADQFKCPQSYVNVTEDARIEKMMKRRYQGLPKTFYRGYRDLDAQDFFQASDAYKLNLIDRINLHFKIGNFRNIPFSSEEQVFVDETGNAETFQEACDVALKIFKYMKETLEEQQTQEVPVPKGAPTDGGQGEMIPSDEKSDAPVDQEKFQEDVNPDADIDNPSFEQGQPEPTDDQQANGQEGTDAKDPLESITDQQFQDAVKDLVENTYDSEYIQIPTVDTTKLVVGWEKLVNHSESYWAGCDTDHEKEELDKSVVEYNEFIKKSQKEINYLIKEFECRKAADSYARSLTSKTGVLNTTVLHQYKYNDDIFKRVTVVPDGKNHGMIFLLDWSGSMSNCLFDTAKQVLQLAHFCRKINIPFRCYGFTYAWNAFYNQESPQDERFVPNYGDISFSNGFCLVEMLSSEAKKKKDFDRSCLTFWRNVASNCSDRGHWYGRHYGFNHAPGLGLSGTPLIEAISAMHSVIPQFKKETGAQKVSLSVLTDGESGPASYFCERNGLFSGRLFENTYGRRCQLRDRKLGKIYQKEDNPSYQVNIFLQNLKERFPEVTTIGFRLVNSRDAAGYLRQLAYMNALKRVDVAHAKFRKDKFVEITESEYDVLYVMPTNTLEDSESIDVEDGAEIKEIRAAFKKLYKGKGSNKKMLSSLSKTIA